MTHMRFSRSPWGGRAVQMLFALIVTISCALPMQGASALDGTGDDLFTNSGIRQLSVEIAPEHMEKLRKYRWRGGRGNQEREDVPATVREGDLVWTNVALHLKGAAGSFRPVDHRPALTLNFDEFVEEQRFHGLQKISLNNSVQDPTYINEKLSREIYRAAGIPVPRADYAMVELNGRSLGLYVLVEGWNKQFLRRFFPDVRGNLYDGAFSRDIDANPPVNSGKNPEDHTALRALVEACAIENDLLRMKRLDELLDLNRFYTLVALDCILWNWDGYTFNRNNYRAFHDRASGKFVIMPHGLDQMLWNAQGPIVSGSKSLLTRAVLGTPEGRQRVLEQVAQLRTNVFHAETLSRRAGELAVRTRPGVAEAGFGSALRHSAEVKALQNRIAERAKSIDEQLAGARELLKFEGTAAVVLTNWTSEAGKSDTTLTRPSQFPPALHISSKATENVAYWKTKVWLEEGTYRLSARIRCEASTRASGNEYAGAGLQVWSYRKIRDGVNWDWFPFRESHSYGTRGEIPSFNDSPRLTGTNDWTEVKYDFELRQPMADLEIRCLLEGPGQAWFDLSSLKITQTSAEVSKSGRPKD